MNNEILMKNLRCIPDFPIKGINFRDVTTLFKNPECVQIMVDELYELYKDKGITKIVGIESRGFVIAAALAIKLGAGIVLCRKPGKLPAETVQESYEKEYGTDTIE
ncbi:MAG: adenine phosphoribosyltransferase, partial [Prevotella sp.]|nr:adenine phosphoribosyltransferase [Prevotella sp.]